MDKKDFEEKIKVEIARTTQLIEEYKDAAQPIAPDDAIGRISRMDAINNKSVVDAAIRQAENKLKGLNYALTKVNSPDFGICLKCKTIIPLGRILLKPESVYCVRCAN